MFNLLLVSMLDVKTDISIDPIVMKVCSKQLYTPFLVSLYTSDLGFQVES